MNKFQNLKFNSVDDLLEYLPENEREIVDILRQLIIDSIPNCVEKLAYNVPYYYRHSRICFIWPSSVPWGNVKLNGVQLGFCNGNLLNDNIEWLDKGNRKQVYTKTFQNINEIDLDLIKYYIFEAVEIDKKSKK
jgi:hypothetical protein